ncbi:MAG: hypothetical protein K0U13_03100, partial [Chlamydiae bacterium]|nr:hypothetical protein [Chlamydiota bacterium]
MNIKPVVGHKAMRTVAAAALTVGIVALGAGLLAMYARFNFARFASQKLTNVGVKSLTFAGAGVTALS